MITTLKHIFFSNVATYNVNWINNEEREKQVSFTLPQKFFDRLKTSLFCDDVKNRMICEDVRNHFFDWVDPEEFEPLGEISMIIRDHDGKHISGGLNDNYY